jgi:hypothetical protein
MGFIQFIVAFAIVFGIGMLIRWAIRKGKKPSINNTAPPPPGNSAVPPQSAAFCPNCGQPVNGDSAFCHNCGAKVK